MFPNILQLQRPIVFLDIETTGVDVKNDRIIEISLIRVEGCNCPCHSNPGVMHIQACCDGGFILSPPLTQRINPGIPIPESASAIHGIKDQDIFFEPPFGHIAPMLLDEMKDCDVAGFNSNSFDLRMLNAEFVRAGVHWNYKEHKLIDIGNLFKLMQPRTLSSAVKTYTGRDHTEAHGAEADVRATVSVFIQMIHKHDEIPKSVEELALMSNFDKPILDLSGKFTYDNDKDIVFTFGQHIGKKAKDNIPYLTWMLKADFAEDTREICKQIMKNGN